MSPPSSVQSPPIPPQRRVHLAVAACLLATACAQTARERGGPRPAAIDRDTALTVVEQLERSRSDGSGRLQRLAAFPDVDVRLRACRALGRLPALSFGDAVTAALAHALEDPAKAVQQEAAFAIGMRGDAGASQALLDALAQPSAADELTRAKLIEAAGKIATPELIEAVLAAFDDPAPQVRVEAVSATHRWPTDLGEVADSAATVAPDPATVDAALIRVANEEPLAAHEAARIEGNGFDVVWRAVFALQRRRSKAARDLYLERARSADHPLTRLFALKGLAGLEPDERTRGAFEHGLLDPDWRVVFEALSGLEKLGDTRSVDALERTLKHPSAHVRAAAFRALGSHTPSERVVPLLERARVDRSANVRAAALEAEASLQGAAAAPSIEVKMASKDPIIRWACARAASHLPSQLGVPYLSILAEDRNHRVASAALEALGEHPTPAAREVLTETLQGRDNGRRLAALLALGSSLKADDLGALRRAFDRSQGDIGAEFRFNSLRSAEDIGSPEAFDFIADALEDPDPYVRQVAYEVLAREGVPVEHVLDLTRAPSDLVPAWTEDRNPIIEISTNRGSMSFELFPREAPEHVHNFLELAKADHYDGLNFHRVVPDFVVQGGCYRGDGNGAQPWNGLPLGHEINGHKYLRGTIGMPRNDDLESGGSQFFVTHRPTPHLDGRYTVFGQLRSGERVLDSLEVGDVILDVRPAR